jgi:hypothetical protein
MVGSFSGDYVGFQNDTVAALAKFKASNVQQLIVDTAGNEGGYDCLGKPCCHRLLWVTLIRWFDDRRVFDQRARWDQVWLRIRMATPTSRN